MTLGTQGSPLKPGGLMQLPKAFFESLPPHHDLGEIERILQVDHLANHKGRSYDYAFTSRAMRLWREQGGAIFCAPSVMFIVEVQTPFRAEFHSVNGGTGRDISAGVTQLLTALAPFYREAATYYDNPRINELLHYVPFASKVTRLDGGEDRTFEAIFNLRS